MDSIDQLNLDILDIFGASSNCEPDVGPILQLCNYIQDLLGTRGLMGEHQMSSAVDKLIETTHELYGYPEETTGNLVDVEAILQMGKRLLTFISTPQLSPKSVFRQPKTYMVDVDDFRDDKALHKAVQRFKARIMDLDTVFCQCCSKMGNKRTIRSRKLRSNLELYTEILSSVLPEVDISETGNEISFVLCGFCWTYILKLQVPPIALTNNLECARIPGQLSLLNNFEKLLIAKNRACQTIVRLPGAGQTGSKGLCIQFPHDVSKFVETLPDNQLLVFRDKSFTRKGLPVRVRMVLSALTYLHRHNHLYHDTYIDMNRFHYLYPEPDEDSASDPNGFDHMSFAPNDLTYESGDSTKTTYRSADYLHLNGPPLKICDVKSWEAAAHPDLFPDGANDFTETRSTKISFANYTQIRLVQQDSRFRTCFSWIFMMASIASILTLRSQSQVYTRMIDDAKPSKEDYFAEKCNISSSSNFNHVQQVRGTEPYWQKILQEVLARCAMWGKPTFFITFSANDIGWPDVYHEILGTSDPDIIARLSYEERETLWRNNPVIVIKHVEKRFRAMLEFILDDNIRPIGKVLHYFIRSEFQMRGSVHYHCLFWIQDAPDPDNKQDLDVLPAFLDKYITVELPDPEENKTLHDLVYTLQRHFCSKCCRRNGEKKCRFGAPFKSSSRTLLLDLTTKGSKRHFYVLRRSQQENLINPYNKLLLLLWGANMDIQMIRGATGLAMYLFAYITKAEPIDKEQLRQDLEEAMERQGSNQAARRILYKTGLVFLRMRSLSVQEAVLQLLHMPYVYSSGSVMFIDTNKGSSRMRFFKTSQQILALEDGSTDTIVPSKWEKYLRRPVLTENVCQASFFINFEILTSEVFRKKEKSFWKSNRPLNEHGQFLPPFQNLFAYRRDKQQCIRFRPLPSEYDDLCYHYLAAFLPHRDDSVFEGSKDDVIELFENSRRDNLLQFDCVPSLSIQEEITRNLERIQLKSAQCIADILKIVPEYEPDIDENVDQSEVDFFNNGQDLDNPEINIGNQGKLQTSDFSAIAHLLPPNWTQLIESMNADQKGAFNYVLRNFSKDIQTLLFITGGAGSGKSYWVDNLRNYFGFLHPDKCVVTTVAPTGVAAFNIRGTTIHSSLGIYPDKSGGKKVVGRANIRTLPPLPDEKLKAKRRQFSDVRFLVIDEISMMSPELFLGVSQRLQQIKNNALPFGGLNVILLGDFYQLPPVPPCWIFQSKNPIVRTLWSSFVPFIFTQNERQKDDEKWLRMLNVIRTGHMTAEIIKFLRSRQNQHMRDPALWENAIHIYETNKDVDEENSRKLRTYHGTMSTFIAKDRQISAKNKKGKDLVPTSFNKCGGLVKKLELKIGAKVIILRNIDLEDGIYNGAIATVFALPLDLSGAVSVLLEKTTSGKITGQRNPSGPGYIVNIETVFAEFKGKSRSMWRREQFPVRLCYAVTNYKCQGLTLDRIVVHIERAGGVGMIYTSLSRVPSSKHLSIGKLPVHLLNNMVSFGPPPSFKGVAQEYERIKSRLPLPAIPDQVSLQEDNLSLCESERSSADSEMPDFTEEIDYIPCDIRSLNVSPFNSDELSEDEFGNPNYHRTGAEHEQSFEPNSMGSQLENWNGTYDDDVVTDEQSHEPTSMGSRLENWNGTYDDEIVTDAFYPPIPDLENENSYEQYVPCFEEPAKSVTVRLSSTSYVKTGFMDSDDE